MGVIARQSIKASLIGFIGVGIGAISKLFIATKYLSPEEIGLIDTITKLTLILMTLFVLGYPQVIKKFYAHFQKDESDSGLMKSFFYLLLITVAISSIVYIFSIPLLHKLYIEKAPLLASYLYIPLLATISFAFFKYFDAICSIKYRIVVPAILNQVINRLLVVLVVLCYGHFLLFDISEFIFYYTISFFTVPLIGIVIYLFYFLKFRFSATNFSKAVAIIKETRKYNFYLILSTFSMYIVQAIDAQMISINLGLTNAGIYSIAFYMGAVINIPKKSLATMSVPLISKAFKEKNIPKIENFYKSSSLNQFLIGSLIFLLVWINIDSLYRFIPNGDSFISGKYVVLYIGLAKLYDMSTGINAQLIEASSFYKYNLFINISLSVLVIVLNLVFIKFDSFYFGGINGIGFASLLAIVISNSFATLIVYLKLRIHPYSSNLFKIFLILITFLLFSHLVDFNFNNNLVDIILKSIVVTIAYVSLNLLFNTSELLKNTANKIKF